MHGLQKVGMLLQRVIKKANCLLLGVLNTKVGRLCFTYLARWRDHIWRVQSWPPYLQKDVNISEAVPRSLIPEMGKVGQAWLVH